MTCPVPINVVMYNYCAALLPYRCAAVPVDSSNAELLHLWDRLPPSQLQKARVPGPKSHVTG
jgi:hypothetical protein